MIAGDPAWTDVAIEVAAMLKGDGGNAGLVFRANDAGPGLDELRGYYAGFDLRTLYLGKMRNSWKELARFDLTALPFPVEKDVWHRLRVEVRGREIRVRFDPLHDDPGLRIRYVDEEDPVLSGAAGVRAFRTEAWFDDFVVLPATAVDP
jgi:hypothetical protein